MDYTGLAFPKPTNPKKKKKTNGYKDKHNRRCIYCGEMNAERHEVYCGSNRQNSIDHGFQIDLCTDHHRELQDNITDWAQTENQEWKVLFQKKYENQLITRGMSKEDARKMWQWLIGRNYTEEIM